MLSGVPAGRPANRAVLMSYIDAFLAPVPVVNRDAYADLVSDVAEIFRKHGAVSYVECWGDEIPPGKWTSMTMAVQAKDDETVVIGWAVWPSKDKRDAAYPALMKDLHTTLADRSALFDGKRMIFGGFTPLLKQ